MHSQHLMKKPPPQRWGPAGQEVERAAPCRQRLLGDPEVPRGGVERPMAQGHLARPDSDPRVALAVQLLARHLGLADAPIFACKRRAINCLQTEVTKPALLVTDYYSGQMRGDELIRLARQASPATKVILFSAVVGSIEGWIAVAGLDTPKPDVIVEKPNTRKLMTVLCQMR